MEKPGAGSRAGPFASSSLHGGKRSCCTCRSALFAHPAMVFSSELGDHTAQHWKDSPLSKEVAEGANPPYDIIILAEVFSIPDLHPELVWTVKQFCHRNIVIWSMFMNRPFSFMFFVHVADSGGFRVHQFKEEEYDVCGLDTEVSAVPADARHDCP